MYLYFIFFEIYFLKYCSQLRKMERHPIEYIRKCDEANLRSFKYFRGSLRALELFLSLTKNIVAFLRIVSSIIITEPWRQGADLWVIFQLFFVYGFLAVVRLRRPFTGSRILQSPWRWCNSVCTLPGNCMLRNDSKALIPEVSDIDLSRNSRV